MNDRQGFTELVQVHCSGWGGTRLLRKFGRKRGVYTSTERHRLALLFSSSYEEGDRLDDDVSAYSLSQKLNENKNDTKIGFLQSDLGDVESFESMMMELEEYYNSESSLMRDEDDVMQKINERGSDVDDLDEFYWPEQALLDIFGDLPDDGDLDEEDVEDALAFYDPDEDTEGDTNGLSGELIGIEELMIESVDERETEASSQDRDAGTTDTTTAEASILGSNDSTVPIKASAMANLEKALLQGVVPVSANVGSDCLPGDFGFDPLNLASKDYFQSTQRFLIDLVPESNIDESLTTENTNAQNRNMPRPKALILRDYREAEIRHGRLAMLAAIFWPLQEQLDQLLLDEDQAGPLLYGPVTLPYFPLLMTLIMLLLGYMDIYSQSIKDRDAIGEAFLPGDCFWDPLRILEGAPDSMKRNMQERELFNGRVAMIAVVAYLWEEAITHLSLAQIQGNELLLKPAYQVPYIQEWLDNQFS